MYILIGSWGGVSSWAQEVLTVRSQQRRTDAWWSLMLRLDCIVTTRKKQTNKQREESWLEPTCLLETHHCCPRPHKCSHTGLMHHLRHLLLSFISETGSWKIGHWCQLLWTRPHVQFAHRKIKRLRLRAWKWGWCGPFISLNYIYLADLWSLD